MRMLIALAFGAFALQATACHTEPPRYVSPPLPPGATGPAEQIVTVWVDPRSTFSVEDTLAGCNLWNPKGIRCVVARNAIEADVAVAVDPLPCSTVTEGKRAVAYAYQSGVIGMRVDCFWKMDGIKEKFDDKMYRLVITHEVGHHLGIWTHVAVNCEKKPDDWPKDKPFICGVAIMNPNYNPDVPFITPMDARAFDERDRGYYSVAPMPVGLGPPSCVYYHRPD